MKPKRLDEAAALLRSRAKGKIDVAIVLGSGLGESVGARVDVPPIAYKKLPGMPETLVAGHAGQVRVGKWGQQVAAVFSGRAHLYQGYSALEVTYAVRLAAHAGARTLVLTNAAGGLNENFQRGDLMLIADHLNLTGTNPLIGRRDLASPFVDMIDAYAPRLRELATAAASDAGLALRSGVYAGLPGPTYETPAEAAYLRRLGADAVGMSTVLETIAARSLGMEVLGISTITNVLGPTVKTSHEEVTATAREAGIQLGRLLDRVMGALT